MNIFSTPSTTGQSMRRIKLTFHTLQQMAGTDDMSVILLTDEAKRRVLSFMCDKAIAQQFTIRINNEKSRIMLPEALLQLAEMNLEMMIVGIFDGQYQVMLSNLTTGASVRLRMSDAVLLSVISSTPLYIEERLMAQQSMPFDEQSTKVAIPINTMDMKSLKSALENAVEKEDYKLASHLRDEIKNRKGRSK